MDAFPSATFHFDRTKCVGWCVFSFAVMAGSIVLAVAAPGERFAEGLMPGWLFGSLGAVLFGAVGTSWLRRALHRGPALELTDAGIVPHARLGGLFSARLSAPISWEDVLGAAPGKHGSVLVRLRDPEAFWARQTGLARALGWRPGPGPPGHVGLGGNDLDAELPELVVILNRVAQERRMPDADHRDALPEG